MIHTSTRAGVEVPDRTLHEHVLADAAERGDAPAIVEGDGVTTYAQLAADVARVAAGLQSEKGIGKGDVVAHVVGNSAARCCRQRRAVCQLPLLASRSAGLTMTT